MFFIRYDAQRRYVWDPDKVQETHQQCQNLAYKLLQQGTHVVVIGWEL